MTHSAHDSDPPNEPASGSEELRELAEKLRTSQALASDMAEALVRRGVITGEERDALMAGLDRDSSQEGE